MAEDRLSGLPDAVIHHILSFVPTVYAVRMSLLSRHWRHMWYSVPTLEFSDSEGFQSRESFDIFVEQCLILRGTAAMRHIADSAATSFKLEIKYSHQVDRPGVFRWLKSPVVQNDVKELDVCALWDCKDILSWSSNRNTYRYRPCMSLNGTSLSTVKLKGVTLVNSCLMNLPRLRSIRLEYVVFYHDVKIAVRNLLMGCPFLEEFVFKFCFCLSGEEIEILSSSLKLVEIDHTVKTVSIDAPNLRSLALHASCRPPGKGFPACKAIRNLALSGFCNGNRETLEDHISKLPCLENLTLRTLDKLGHINIVSPTLQCFSLIKYKGVESMKVNTETPNLVSFKYVGNAGLSINMATPNPQMTGKFAILCPYPGIYDSDNWYKKLITFLANINCVWKSLSLVTHEEKAFIIPEEIRKTCCPPLPRLKHLKVTAPLRFGRTSELREAMKWLSPSLETLSIEGK